MATECIGLGIDDFERCTPSEFQAIVVAWNDQRQNADRSEWERARMQCLCMLQPHSKKKLKPRDVLQFAWDGDHIEDESEMITAKEIRERFEKVKKEMGM